MNWIAENWVVLALLGGMGGMHLFGHRHGKGHRSGARVGRGGCCGGGKDAADDASPERAAPAPDMEPEKSA